MNLVFLFNRFKFSVTKYIYIYIVHLYDICNHIGEKLYIYIYIYIYMSKF